jgi:hypothetical protein
VCIYTYPIDGFSILFFLRVDGKITGFQRIPLWYPKEFHGIVNIETPRRHLQSPPVRLGVDVTGNFPEFRFQSPPVAAWAFPTKKGDPVTIRPSVSAEHQEMVHLVASGGIAAETLESKVTPEGWRGDARKTMGFDTKVV